MGTKSVGNGLEKTRILLSMIWFSIVTIIALVIYTISMGTNPNGESCSYNNQSHFHLYQMIWEHKLCVYSFEYYVTFYCQFIPLFLLYDYVRRKIIGYNQHIGWRMAEVGAWFALNWGSLLWLTATQYGILNDVMLITSFLGTLLFFIPIIMLTTGVRFLSNSAVIRTFWGIIVLYIVMIVIAAMHHS